MPQAGPEPDDAERIAAHADIHRSAWERTLAQLTDRADELREAGWTVVATAAGHTAPEHPDVGDSDRFGLVYVVPDSDADAFAAAFAAGDYPEYQVYHRSVEGRVFLLTELRDPAGKRAILVAGNFELRHAPPLVKTAGREGEMYTHVQRLDGTYLGSFRHDDWEKFFPNAERITDKVR